jgi:glucose/arabinose dehydrogenase/mono/diheme cytochrome c family protein
VVFQCAHAQAASRVANTTLTFPQEPFAYSTVDAFPGLTFDSAVALVTPPGETNCLFVVEKDGRIFALTNLAAPNKSLFLDLSARVNPAGEGGLLGLAFHPGYASNRQFFVYYTLNANTAAGSGLHDRLARFETSLDNPHLALAASETPLITQFDESEYHNGGDLHFGPDGYLYVSLGDEGGGNGGFGNTHFITRDFFAGILRLDVDQRPGSLPPNPHPAVSGHYAIPPDNPFIGATNFDGVSIDPAQVRTEYWAVGLRNPWRFSFDPVTGRLFCGDVGEGAREEINVILKGGHYGWNYREGRLPANGVPPAGMSFVEPILDYPHGGGNFEGNAITGGFVYRGARHPQLDGDYLFGDHLTGNIWALRYDGTNVSNWRRLTGLVGVAAFGLDPSRQDILMTLPWDAGEIQRLIYRTTTSAPLPQRLSDTGAFSNLGTLQPHAGIVPYDINTPFWSDGALKRRWFSVPRLNQFIGFNSNANWSFPTGTVWIKHFDLELTNSVPASARRLETRFLVKNTAGLYGVTYRWNTAQTDATLVPETGAEETILIHEGGTNRLQLWRYPARNECLVCHTPVGGYALGFNTPQLNRPPDAGGTNQILNLGRMGYLIADCGLPIANCPPTPVGHEQWAIGNPQSAIPALPAYTHATNTAATLEHRVRSYLGANCVHCHQPGGTGRGAWDARLATPLAQAGLIPGPVVDDFGNTENRVIRPGSLEHSILYTRVAEPGPRHMPPLGTTELDRANLALLAHWITNDLAGPQIQAVLREPDGRIRITFSGTEGRAYRIESSADLVTWQPIGSATAGVGDQGEYLESAPPPPAPPRRYYRLAWP